MVPSLSSPLALSLSPLPPSPRWERQREDVRNRQRGRREVELVFLLRGSLGTSLDRTDDL